MFHEVRQCHTLECFFYIDNIMKTYNECYGYRFQQWLSYNLINAADQRFTTWYRSGKLLNRTPQKSSEITGCRFFEVQITRSEKSHGSRLLSNRLSNRLQSPDVIIDSYFVLETTQPLALEAGHFQTD